MTYYKNGRDKKKKKRFQPSTMFLFPKIGSFAIANTTVDIYEDTQANSPGAVEKVRHLEAGEPALVVEVPDPHTINPLLPAHHRKNATGSCMKILHDELAYYVPKNYLSYFVFTDVSEKIKGKNFCITGELNYVRETYASLIKLNGGDYKTAITKQVDYLITNNTQRNTTKLQKARQAGITVINEAEFFRLIA